MHAFAQELYDLLIDSCHLADPKSMKACGLVCRRWLPRSRYNLFSSVYLSARTLASFVDLVEASSLPILSFIRALELYYDDAPPDTVLLERLHCCPNLTDIRIELRSLDPQAALDWLMDESLRTHVRAWGNHAISISRLALAPGPLVFPFHTIIGLVACVPTISDLAVFNASITSEADVPPPFPLDLQRLTVLGSGGHFLFRWLLSLPVVPALRHLSLLVYRPNKSIQTYFQRAGGELESLRVFLPLGDSITPLRDIFPYTNKLEDVSIFCFRPVVIPNVIQLMPSSILNVFINFRTPVIEAAVPWPAIDAALAEPRFRVLQRFCIYRSEEQQQSSTPFNIKLLLPLANARGIL
ncbi:hypothetical protein DFH09DRAFT_1222093 [Mycena vulgaris]|nr:hypothetical protein DFH09DRAFT_1222093 [Mycena vulgaris]